MSLHTMYSVHREQNLDSWLVRIMKMPWAAGDLHHVNCTQALPKKKKGSTKRQGEKQLFLFISLTFLAAVASEYGAASVSTFVFDGLFLLYLFFSFFFFHCSGILLSLSPPLPAPPRAPYAIQALQFPASSTSSLFFFFFFFSFTAIDVCRSFYPVDAGEFSGW